MKFKEYIKKQIRLTKIDQRYSCIDNIYAQYNPDRFDLYASCTPTKRKFDKLNIKFSPHYKLAKLIFENGIDWAIINIEKTNYYKMQSLYGKKHSFIIKKVGIMNDIIKLFFSESNAFEGNKIDLPDILSSPIIPNEYSYHKYEIWEGHHRISCALACGYENIKCNLYSVERTS